MKRITYYSQLKARPLAYGIKRGDPVIFEHNGKEHMGSAEDYSADYFTINSYGKEYHVYKTDIVSSARRAK